MGQRRDEFESTFAVGTFDQTVVANDCSVQTRRQRFKSLDTADVGTGNQYRRRRDRHQRMQAIAQRHGLSTTLSRKRAKKVVTIPASSFTGFGVTDEVQRCQLVHTVTLALAEDHIPGAAGALGNSEHR